MNQRSIHDRIMSRKPGKDAGQANLADPKRPARSWLRMTVFSLLGVAVVGAAGFTAMRYEAIGNFVSQPAVAKTNETNQMLADTPFAQHARQAGLQSCSTVFPVLGELLTIGTTYSVQSVWNNEAADKHVVQALVGMDYATEGYSGPAAGVVFAAPTASACEGAMVRVAPFAAPCADIPAMLPKGSRIANNLGQISIYQLPNDGGNAMLLPTGNSCVVISVASAAAKQGSAK